MIFKINVHSNTLFYTCLGKIQSGTDGGQNPVAASSCSPNVVLKRTSQFTTAMSEQTSSTDPLKITSRQKLSSQGVTATVAGNQIASSNNAGLGRFTCRRIYALFPPLQ